MLNARRLPWRLAQAVVCLLACAPALAARENCVSIDGVGVLQPTAPAGSTIGTYGPITKCSVGHLRIVFNDEVFDSCGQLVGIYGGSLIFDNRRSTEDTWIVGTHVDIGDWACLGEATLVRSAYGPGQEFLAAARGTFTIVKP